MIKKFRRRFILLAMAALLLVLSLIIGGINIYNFHEVAEDADELLEIISINRGKFPEELDVPSAHNGRNENDFHGRKPDNDLGRLSPETPYETRYFYIGISVETGEADLIETSKIVAVDAETAEQMAREALEKEKTHGYVGEYRFYIARGRVHTYVVFVDCGRTLESAKRFLATSLTISAAGYLLVFVIVAFLSRYAIRPVMAGYEKQRQFISNAGHEIKTPLTIIRADADVLEMDIGENEWISDIRQQVQRLSDLTEELSKLSRMDESELPIVMTELDFSSIAARQVQAFEAPAKTGKLKLRSSIQPDLSVRGNEKALNQLCSVLLDNAVKYSVPGSEIEVCLEKNGSRLLLCVSNPSRHPLPLKDLDQLFERFYRTDPSRSSETGGFGIGLAIAKAVAQGHGGKIWAECPDGIHLSISVILPLL